MPTLNSAYWIMSVLVAQVYIVMYLLMFAAAIRLRYTKPAHERPYRVPGGKIGMWIIAGMGIASSLLTLVIGFFPPAQIPTGNATFYVTFLAVSLGVICLAPSLILRFKTPEWSRRLSHEGKEEL
jgi:amino acid transporter